MKSPLIVEIRWPKIINFPQTTTILALGFLAGCLLYTPMIAALGKQIDPAYRDSVSIIVGLFKDGMLLILGFYFAKVVNAEGRVNTADKTVVAMTRDLDAVNRRVDAEAQAHRTTAESLIRVEEQLKYMRELLERNLAPAPLRRRAPSK